MDQLRILVWNCRSISNKTMELTKLCPDYDLVILTETWLNPRTQLSIPNFHIIRKDRQNRNGGGVAILLKKGFRWHTADNIICEDPNVELIAIEVTTNHVHPLTIVACYRPPTHNLTLNHWERFIKTLCDKGSFLLAGDFNAAHPMWNCKTVNPAGENLYRILNEHNLIVHNTESHSHIEYNQQTRSNLDLVISKTDIAHLITTLQLDDSLGSDHFPISCSLSTGKYIYQKKTNRLSSVRTNWKQYKTDMDSLYYTYFLSYDFSALSPADKYDSFVDKMTKATIANTPNKPKKTQISNPVGWWDNECNQAVRQRKAHLKKWLFTLSMEDWVQYKKQAAKARRLFRTKKREAFKDFAGKLNCKSNPAHFWSIIKRFKSKWAKTKAEVGDSTQQDSHERTAVSKICPPWVPDPPPTRPQADSEHRHPFLDQMFNYTELNLALEKCKRTSAPGPDRIDYDMILSLSDKCKLLLLDIFNELYQTQTIPEAWKKVHIFLIPKHTGHSLRPITLSSCMGKLMERLLNSRLLWWVEHNGILPHYQSGFRKGRSCSDNIGTLVTTADTGYRTKKYTAAAFLDINSAFDNVQRQILLQQLDQLGISGNITHFISNMMYERQAQFIGSLNLEKNHHSYNIYKGLPQGGVLSPLLFNLYVRNIMDNIPCEIMITQYADDIALIAQNSDSDHVKTTITKAVQTIRTNLQEIGLDLATAKTELLWFGNSPRMPCSVSIQIDDIPIHSKPVVKFLGVRIDNRLNFQTQTEHVIKHCSKALNVIRFLRGTWWGCDPQTLILVYKSLIRAKIEYGSIWYYPVNNSHRRKLEGIQNEAIRLALGYRRTTPVNIIQAESKLPSIMDRTTLLGAKYIARVVSNSSHPLNEILENFSLTYRTQYHTHRPSPARIDH